MAFASFAGRVFGNYILRGKYFPLITSHKAGVFTKGDPSPESDLRRGKNTPLGRISQSDYQMIYKLPYIPVVSLVNRMKLHLTRLSCVALPSSMVLYQANIFPWDICAPVMYISATCCLPFYLLGLFGHRLVGYMYLSADMSTVRMSYVDFWGSRREILCPTSDILPLSECDSKYGGVYVNIKLPSQAKALKLSIKFGDVIDKNNFQKVFGN